VHLVRHGEVHNPGRVLYGTMPGFGLSDLGYRMAESAAKALHAEGAPVQRVLSSPLQRARESAEPWTGAFGLDVDIDERLIEPFNRFEGRTFNFGTQVLRNPGTWGWVLNPMRPSWGEAYESIATRMLAAMAEARESVDDGDVVLVSHQLPIWMVHRKLQGQALWHDPRKRRCTLSSITTFELLGKRFVETGYRDPTGGMLDDSVDLGAV
jgi:broad specificity phosphatase PhoE